MSMKWRHCRPPRVSLVRMHICNFPQKSQNRWWLSNLARRNPPFSMGLVSSAYTQWRASLYLIHYLRLLHLDIIIGLSLFCFFCISECNIIIGALVSRSRMANKIAKAIGRTSYNTRRTRRFGLALCPATECGHWLSG
jgi:hypothetical protein